MLENFCNNYSDVISTKELCKILNISPTTAYKILREKQIPSKKIGREYKITKESIYNYLNKN